MRDGPSVIVKEQGKAERRVPARLIGRVVIVGNVPMESGVVTLFACQGTPVLFLDTKESRPAITMLCEERGPQRWTRQHLLFRRPPSADRLRMWLQSRRRASIIRVVRRLSPRLGRDFQRGGFREEHYQELLRPLRRNNPRWQVLVGMLRAMTLEFIVPFLERAKFDPHCGVLHRGEDFGLALDFCWVLEPELHYQALRFFKDPSRRGGLPWRPHGEEMREVVQRFENRKPYLRSEVQALIDEILDLMRQADGDDLSRLLRHRRQR
ncbi:MAG TPA: hypothetical protein ENG73_09500 [Desulfobacterales bacterium]|nr:hypothetical protein [Desulfobacterales bacterium]